MKKSRKNNKKVIIAALTLGAFIAVGAYGVNNVLASDNGNQFNLNIIKKLSERFSLDEDEVKAVFNENRDENKQRVQQQFEERINQSVADGKITEEQKQAIIKKKEELQSQGNKMRDELKNLSADERKLKREKNREDMEKWAEENSIDLKEIKGFNIGRGFEGRHPNKGMMK